MRAVPHKDKESIRHEVLLCASVATLSFVVFQVLDLQDSISAQAASILILFSLCFKAAGTASWQRIIGTLIGCNAALVEAHTTYGRLGVKVWIMKGEVYGKRDLSPLVGLAKKQGGKNSGRSGNKSRRRK